MEVIEQNIITSQYDFVRLGIIDWNRLNGTSATIADAMHDISSWFIGHAAYTIIGHNLKHAPERDDFPGWSHAGSTHERLGRLFWNDFKLHYPEGELIFSDEPDFYGTLRSDGKDESNLWGDIGHVSASAFALTAIRQMQKGDLWISVLGDDRQIIIEVLDDLQQLFRDQVIVPLLDHPNSQRARELRAETQR